MISENLHSGQEFYMTTGRTGHVKYQLYEQSQTLLKFDYSDWPWPWPDGWLSPGPFTFPFWLFSHQEYFSRRFLTGPWWMWNAAMTTIGAERLETAQLSWKISLLNFLISGDYHHNHHHHRHHHNHHHHHHHHHDNWGGEIKNCSAVMKNQLAEFSDLRWLS